MGSPFKRIRSVTFNKCGELKNPVLTSTFRRMDSTSAHVDPYQMWKIYCLNRYSDTFRRINCTFPLVPAIWMTDNLSRSSNVTPIFSKYLEVSDTFVHSELWVRPIAFCNVVVFVCSAFNAEIASYNRNKQSRHSPNKTGSDMQILTSYERRSIPFNLEAKWASERQLKVNKCVGANDGPPISNTILTGNRLKILFIYLCPALKLVTSLFN